MFNKIMLKSTAALIALSLMPTGAVLADGEKEKPDLIYAAEDSYVWDGDHADENHGSDNKLWVKDSQSAGMNRKAFIKFDLTDIDPDFESATLKLNWNPAQYGDRNIPIVVSGASDNSWSESTVTWNNMPNIDNIIETKDIMGWQGMVSFDVTDYIKSCISAEYATIAVENGKGNDSKVEFLSRENSAGGPVIDFKYKGSSKDFGPELDTDGYEGSMSVYRSVKPVRLVSPSNFESNRETVLRGGLPNFFRKINEGKSVTIAYLGGSITNAEGYRPISLKWMQEHFTGSSISGINAGIPGTGTDLAVFRTDSDVISSSPDLVFVEFAANGGSMEALEGVVRKIWKNNPETDICFLYSISSGNQNSYVEGDVPLYIAQMEEVAEHYSIPSVHMGIEAALLESKGLLSTSAADKADGKINFSEDRLHPTDDFGAPYYAAAIARSVMRMESAPGEVTHVIKQPLNDAAAGYDLADTISPESADRTGGWVYNSGEKYWQCENENESFSFEFSGNKVGIFYMSTPQSGIASIEVDGKEIGEINMFEASTVTVNKFRYKYFDVEDAEHKVTVKLTDKYFDKAASLSGSELNIYNSNKEKWDREFAKKNAYIYKALIIGETSLKPREYGVKSEIIAKQDFDKNYSTSDWLLRHMFSVGDGVLKASISDSSMAKQAVEYSDYLKGLVSGGQGYRMVIKSKMKIVSGSCYAEIGLATGEGSSNSYRRLFWLDSHDSDGAEVSVKYGDSSSLNGSQYPTKEFKKISFDEAQNVWIVIDAFGSSGKVSYYVNGEKISGEYDIKGLDGSDQVRLAHQYAGQSEFDDFEFYIITGGNLKAQCVSVTDSDGNELPKESAGTDFAAVLNFATEMSYDGLAGAVTINGEAVGRDRIQISEDGKTATVLPPNDKYDTVSTYTIGLNGAKDIFGEKASLEGSPSFTTGGRKIRAKAAGFDTDKLQSGEITAKFEVKNAGDEAAKVNIILLLCEGTDDDYMVVRHEVKEISLAANTGYIPAECTIAAENITNESFVKALVWTADEANPVLDTPIILKSGN